MTNAPAPFEIQAIANIQTIEEAKDGYEKLKALVSYFGKDYEQAFNFSVNMIEYACRGGKLLQSEGGLPGTRTDISTSGQLGPRLKKETIKEAGLTPTTAKRWQKMASVPIEKRQEYYAKLRDKSELPTNSGILSIAKQLLKQSKKQQEKDINQEIESNLSSDNPNEIRLGDWWQLGNHLLYCGDTSSQEFIDRLPQVSFAFADPPYNAGVDNWDNDFNWKHDYLIDKTKIVAVTPGIASIFDFAKITRMPYVWSFSCWIDNGMTRGAMGYGNWIYGALFSYESVYRQTQDMIRVSIKTNDNRKEYKGRKPPGLLKKLVELYADNDIVIDPFLGTGTTLLVCEQMGLVCYGGEVQPELCNATIGTWQEMTGKKAVKL